LLLRCTCGRAALQGRESDPIICLGASALQTLKGEKSFTLTAAINSRSSTIKLIEHA
jgi:hypothetical protein